MSIEIEFPIEFLVRGTPASAQTKLATTRDRWKQNVRQASLSALPEGHFTTEAAIAVTLFYFPLGDMQGDLDNIVKPVLDALCRHIYLDDSQVERIWVERFGMRSVRRPAGTGESILSRVTDSDRPVMYVRLSVDLQQEPSPDV